VLSELLGDESEHMTTPRQATPFEGALTPEERWSIYEAFKLCGRAPATVRLASR